MYVIRKKFKAEIAHVLSSSYSEECQRVHGHSYVFEVFVKSPTLNADGMVCDFKKLKEEVLKHLQKWDHQVLACALSVQIKRAPADSVVVPSNPTAEWMAEYLCRRISEQFFSMSVKVRVHETDTGWAEFYEEKEWA
jgi:6-pyruvoyltetrahydropterin/6-carboxytetrahydropterin synthase